MKWPLPEVASNCRICRGRLRADWIQRNARMSPLLRCLPHHLPSHSGFLPRIRLGFRSRSFAHLCGFNHVSTECEGSWTMRKA